MEWSYSEAVTKLSNMLGLARKIAEYEISCAVNGATDAPVPQDRFDAAMRIAQRDPENKISPSQLSHALIHFYAELRGKTVEIDILSTSTAQAILATLENGDMISSYDHGTILFFYIMEGCSADRTQLLAEFKYDLRNAVVGGLSRKQINRDQARIAEFCLLTGLGPFEARDEGESNLALRKDAREDLYPAVEKALKTLIKLSKRETALRLVQARLFPLKYVVEEVRSELLMLGLADYKNDPIYVVAGEKFLIRFFQQHTAVGVQEAKAFLEENDWYMAPAINQWRSRIASGPHTGSRDSRGHSSTLKENTIAEKSQAGAESSGSTSPTQRPTDDHLFQTVVKSLIQHYENSFPTRLPKDHQLQHMIENFKRGGLSSEPNLRIFQSHLGFRAAKCAFAQQIVRELNLYKDAAAVPIDEWDPHQNPGYPHRQRMGEIGLILRHGTKWFQVGQGEGGMGYEKPWLYVSNAMVLGRKSDGEVRGFIGVMESLRACDLW